MQSGVPTREEAKNSTSDDGTQWILGVDDSKCAVCGTTFVALDHRYMSHYRKLLVCEACARKRKVLRAHHAPLLACDACLEKSRNKCGRAKTEAEGGTAECLEKSGNLYATAILARRTRIRKVGIKKVGINCSPPSPLRMSFKIQGKTHAITWTSSLTPSPPPWPHSSLSTMVLSTISVESKSQIKPRLGPEQGLRRAGGTLVARSSPELEGRSGRHAMGTYETQRTRERSGGSGKKRVDRAFSLGILSFCLMVMSAGLAWSGTMEKGGDFLFLDHPKKLGAVSHRRIFINRRYGCSHKIYSDSHYSSVHTTTHILIV